jgi:hypothetical protein
MTDDEKYQHQLKLNRERQRRYYEANKNKILANKKSQRDANCVTCQTQPEPNMPAENTNILDRYKNKLIQLDKNTEKSVDDFVNHLATFMQATKCENLEKCLKKPKVVLKLLDTAISAKTGGPFSTNSKKSYVNAMLKAIDSLKLKVNKKPYLDYKKKIEIMSSNEHSVKLRTEKVENIKTYLENVGKKFGESSKEYMLSRLYDEAPLRDDFHQLIIISTENQANDKTKNYIKIPRSGPARVIANDYKTSKGYGTIKIDLTIALTNLIRKYINDNKIGYNQGLFGDKKRLSAFVSNMNKKLGYKGGISLFRKMKISTLLTDEGITDVELRQELSDKMAHKPATQLLYLRQLYDRSK